jgi:hypothetical protein
VTRVIEADTGVVLEEGGYASLEDAERALFASIDQETDQRLRQIQILLDIQERQLYRQRLDEETNEPFETMHGYMKAVEAQLAAVSGSKFRSLLNWMTKWRVYVLQMGRSGEWLKVMGTHAELLLPAAARHVPTSTLQEEDQVTKTGRRLGLEHFTALVEEIEQHVAESKAGHYEWTLEDTRSRVSELLGKETLTARCEINAHWVGDDVRLDRVGWWLDEFHYNPGDIVPLDHFRQIAKSAKVEGLGENWRK